MRAEIGDHPVEAAAIGFWQVFALTSFRDRNLFAASQAGLVNNLNDGMSWGIFPLFFDAGRGFVMATKLGATEEERGAAMTKEKERREKGMAISFALGAATLVIGILSFIMSFI